MFSKTIETAKFIARRRFRGFDVPDEPHLDPDGLEYFREKLSASRVYLEYGAGGSTVEASRQHKTFIAVESDPFFVASLKKKVGSHAAPNLIYANIGLTGPWGVPLFSTPTPARIKRWSNYPNAPWRFFNDLPDLILIDGRFRALCALTVIEKLRGRPFELLFNDYLDRRDSFSVVEKFAELRSFKGRIAVFGPKDFNSTDLDLAKQAHAADFA
jgi:hypothetical protein